MPATSTPRGQIKNFLRGHPPPSPLLLPILFALGSRLENLSLRDFQSNPSKMANGLRQVRAAMKVDGVACVFNPFLEAEALGFSLHLQADGSSRPAHRFADLDDLRQNIVLWDSLPEKGPLRVASDVLERLNILLKDEPVLMVGVNGPLALAAQFLAAGLFESPPSHWELAEFTAEVTACVARELAKAGADAIFLAEEAPVASAEAAERWPALLDPIVNIIRFYDALPVLLMHDAAHAGKALPSLLHREWNFVCALPVGDVQPAIWEAWRAKAAAMALALPPEMFTQAPPADLTSTARRLVAERRPLFVTTAGDVPLSADIKQVTAILSAWRAACSTPG